MQITLNDEEKNIVLSHEEVHVRKWHSFDIILLRIISIAFWFNPILSFYKKSLVLIHEFEADARSVKVYDMNTYCNLLVKVALRSSEFPLANHFTNSLTIKRINMMNTIRKKISTWKVVAISISTILLFLAIACQDQVMQEIQTITYNSTAATLLPAEVQSKLEALKKENPKAEYTVYEMNETGKRKLEELNNSEDFSKYKFTMHFIKVEEQAFVILQKGENTNSLAEMTTQDGDVFTVVEESAMPKEGLTKFYEDLAKNIKYPEQARSKNIYGKVFVEFIVNTDGSINDIKIIKGIGGGCDEEAVRVLQEASPWIPGKQKGVAVKQRLVIPIIFTLGTESPATILNGSTN